MKKVDRYIERPRSVLTGEATAPLHTLTDFPVYMGCVETPIEGDIVADMEWGIDPYGMIQLTKLLPLETLYLAQHNDGVGRVWQEHYRAFATFLLKYAKSGKLLEVGGAHDTIASYYLAERPADHWTIVEPNPGSIQNPRITLIRGWFDGQFVPEHAPTTLVHSHVLEHMYQPVEFLRQVHALLPEGGRSVFSFPDMEPMLAHKFTNCLNFEHTAFLAEPFVEWAFRTIGFNVIAKEYFGEPHSIFYAIEKSSVGKAIEPPDHHDSYKKLFTDFIAYHEDEVATLNARIAAHDGPVYLFGAHIFSQYLVHFGLRTERISSILDNSAFKQGKRLYATTLTVESPQVLAGAKNAAVILRAGIYNDEIRKDVTERISSEVEFW